MGRVIIVTTQKWDYARWMHGQVSNPIFVLLLLFFFSSSPACSLQLVVLSLCYICIYIYRLLSIELMVFKSSTFWSSTSITHLMATWDLQGANALCARKTLSHNYITDESINKQIKFWMDHGCIQLCKSIFAICGNTVVTIMPC